MSELILICVFKFWPETEIETPAFVYFEREAIQVEEVIITRQANTAAAPPKPQVPIPVPTDEFIEEDIEFPELENLISFDPLSTTSTTGQTGDEERISGNPDRRPRVVRIVEPTLTTEAKNSGTKAMIFVNFTVNKSGNVLEATIAEIRLYKSQGNEYEVVQTIGYGILPAVIEAAFKWKFRPAQESGEAVGAYTQDVFNIGF